MDFSFAEDKCFNPMVSIIIPVYNGSNYLKEAIDSALGQTYKNIEVIVVNDGSRDKGVTEKIAKSYGSRIRYFAKENGGVSSALNEGIRQMRGEYFSWLSHDDVYCPEKIEQSILALMQENDKTMIIRCATEYIDKNSRPIVLYRKTKTTDNRIVEPWDKALLSLYTYGTYNGCALLIHKSVFDECGMFDERFRFNQDGLMWTNIFLQRFSLCTIPYVGVQSRIHSGQLTRKGMALFHEECDLMANQLIPKLEICTDEKTRLLFAYGKYNAKHENTATVHKLLCSVNRKKLSTLERAIIRGYGVYGIARFRIKKIYYELFRHIRVKE